MDDDTERAEAWGRLLRSVAAARSEHPSRLTDRNDWIVVEYRRGRTMADIAAEAGISKGRVSQIIDRACREADVIP